MTLYFISIWFLLILKFSSADEQDVHIFGFTANGWDYIRELFKENFIQNRDIGASMAIYHQGELVVDLSGGWIDKTQLTLYDNNTLQLVFSTSKGLVAIAVALCVQRGLLDYSALVTNYWPEYGKNGKQNTTVADILSHRAGLPFDSSPFEQYYNWTAMINTLEQQKPLWIPGTSHGYHALTYGWLAGELVRRVDSKNRTLGEFIRDEIAQPLNIEFYIGLPPEQEYRVSPLYFYSPTNTPLNQSLLDSLQPYNNRSTYEAEIPAANGITNARSLAKLYASLLSDVDNKEYKRLLNEEILKQATESNTPENELDLVLLVPSRFSFGFLLMSEMFPSLGLGTFGHSGFGGSIGFAAPERNLSFAYVVNQLDIDLQAGVDHRYRSMLEKIAAELNKSSSYHLRFSFYSLILCCFLLMF